MKVTLKNNSCGGLNRRYHKYTLDLKGHGHLENHEVPDHIADDLLRYLRKHHPAVEITVEEAPSGLSAAKPAPVLTPAATTADKTVVDINVDDEEAGITVEQHLRNLGLISDAAPAEAETPASAPASAQVEAPASPAPAKGKKGGAANLKPAKSKGKAADKPGGTK